MTASIDATLTQGERQPPTQAGGGGSRLPPVFALAGSDPEPLPKPTRLALEWEGQRWAEYDPTSWRQVDAGTARASGHPASALAPERQPT